jgi:hypothetical protein
MNPASPTPAPIHDIVGPVWFWPYPLWLTILVGLLALILLGGILWGLRKLLVRKKTPLTPGQQALAGLDLLRSRIAGAEPYQFGVSVSDVVRRYIQSEHGLQATKQTSLEFLETIGVSDVFSENEKAGIAILLERTDLLKFARAEAGEPEMLDLLETAVRLIRGEVQSEKPKK